MIYRKIGTMGHHRLQRTYQLFKGIYWRRQVQWSDSSSAGRREISVRSHQGKYRLAHRKDTSGANEWLQVIGFQDVTVLDILSVGFNSPSRISEAAKRCSRQGHGSLALKIKGINIVLKSCFRITKAACQKFPCHYPSLTHHEQVLKGIIFLFSSLC